VLEAYEFAVSSPVDWSMETLPGARARVEQALREAYPFLNQDSIRRLGSCFAYAWK
jgi:hypothetical protein